MGRSRVPRNEWPREGLDLEALRRDGWSPTPFRQFVVKVSSRCNLACDYCYLYESPDESWRIRPVRMPRSIVQRAAEQVAVHARYHALRTVDVVLHGGEPLLVGRDYLDFVCRTFRDALEPGIALNLCVQTNGTLLDEDMLRVLGTHEVRIGLSVDGGAETHDAHRAYHDGTGSHADIASALDLLRRPAYRRLFSGLLAVVDPGHDPIRFYEQLVALEPPTIDLLLPHANWSRPPLLNGGYPPGRYGDWLIAVFDRWYLAPRHETRVRLFEEVIRGLFGRSSRSEVLGLAPVSVIVIETDGDIEQVDTLKSVYDGAARTGLNVLEHSLDEALALPEIAARQIGERALAESCRRCDLRAICGAGSYPHRYRRGSGFRNPSVYCEDLAALIRHVHARLRTDLGGSPSGAGLDATDGPRHLLTGSQRRRLEVDLHP